MLEKFAKSTDPVQQALRDHKKRWNLASKEFIKRLIAFKKGINGRGAPNYGLPVSNIKDPMPTEIGSFLNELSGNFQQLAEEALQIEKEQTNYSQNRKKPVDKSVKKPEEVIPSPLQEPAKIATASMETGAYLAIGNKIIPTLLAITAEEQERGLMYRDWPPPVMSFVYSTPQVNRFWMKATPSPLDIIFSLKGKIVSIHKGEPYSTKLIGDYENSDLVVEMPYGTYKAMGLNVGDKISLVQSVKKLEEEFGNKYSGIK